MLKLNSKQAIKNIKNYIIENFDASSYTSEKIKDYKNICKFIYNCFLNEKYNSEKKYYKTIQDAFISWCQGLPSVLDTCYYYNREAKKDLMTILEETEEEAKKYNERQSEKMITYLIFREITKNIK